MVNRISHFALLDASPVKPRRPASTRLTAIIGVLAIVATSLVATPAGSIELPPGGIIDTYAGGGAPTPHTVIPANLETDPKGITRDSGGRVYFSDPLTDSVNVLSADGSTVSVLAGTGTSGYSGDGGPANSAQLDDPAGLTLTSGGLFIADTGNNVIRRVDLTTGMITTMAGNGTYGYSGDGGPASSAQLRSPAGLTADGSGHVFIADANNNVIRRVELTTGTITTMAGTGMAGYIGDGGSATLAQLDHPRGLAMDSSGNLYIADTSNNVIRMVTPSGYISTVAGNGSPGYSGDGGPATSAELFGPRGLSIDAWGRLYIADSYNYVIRQIVLGSGTISTVAGTGTSGYSGDGGPATSAQINYPAGVVADGSGGVYIADQLNGRIRRVDNSYVITTVLGGGTESLFGVGDGGPASSAQLETPRGVVVDDVGNVYIADVGHHRVRKVDASTGVISTVAGTGVPGYSGDGGPATSAQLNSPTGLALDQVGNVYIAEVGDHRVRKVDASTGVISTVAGTGVPGYSGDGGPAISAQLAYPYDVAVDAIGNLYIADTINKVVRKVDVSTGVISTVAGTGADGYSGDGGPATSAQLGGPKGVVVDATGNLYIADPNYSVVRKVDTAGVISTFAGTGVRGWGGNGGPATSAQLGYPASVAVDSQGNVFIAGISSSQVRKVDTATGIISRVAGNGIVGFSGDGGPASDAALDGPSGVAVDVSGNLFIADRDNDRIRVVGVRNAPSAPTMVRATAANGQATVSWIASYQDGGSPINGYTVTADPGGATCATTGQNPSTLCVVTGLTDGVPYTFTVTASNAVGTGSPSLPSMPVTPKQRADITGTVTEADSGTPLANVCVSLWSGNAQERMTCTDNNGEFAMIDVAEGTYTLSYFDPIGVHPTVWSGGASTQTAATPVVITTQVPVDASLTMDAVSGSISGTVQFDVNDPSKQACVYLYGTGSGSYQGLATCTNSHGVYVLSGVPAGDYVLAFVDPGGLARTTWSGDAATQATAATITTDGTTPVTGAGVTMPPLAGALSGMITDPSGNPMANVCLYGFAWTGSGLGNAVSATCTNATGGYALSSAGVGQIAVVDPTGTYPTLWIGPGGWPSFELGSRPSSESVLSLPASGTFASSLAFRDAGSLSGTVTDDGSPLAGACVYAYYADHGTYTGAAAMTDASGSYTIPNLAPNQPGFGAGYKVAFYRSCAQGQSPTLHWNGGANSQESATPVVVSEGITTGAIDADF